MSRVAKELGVSAMSLYRYVAAKDELLALMVDAALGAAAAARRGEDWRAGIDALGVGVPRRAAPPPLGAARADQRAAAHAQPGRLARGRPGRAGAAPACTRAEKLSVMLLVSGFVRNEATLAADIARPRGVERGGMPAWAACCARLTDAERFPALHAAIGLRAPSTRTTTPTTSSSSASNGSSTASRR